MKEINFPGEAYRLVKNEPIKRQMRYVCILEAMQHLPMKEVKRVLAYALALEAANEAE